MRRASVAAAVCAALVGCAAQPSQFVLPSPPAEVPPWERQAHERIRREERLVALALAGSPDLPTALRRAAEENAAEDGLPPAPGPRASRRERQAADAAREAKIREEEERLRQRVQTMAQARAATVRDQQAAAVCAARAQMAAAMYPDRSLVRLDAMIAGAQVHRACVDMYRATGMVPNF
ncbi:hypothetical protein GCM10010964_43640 [Caldovatus sediminis]|uniref:Lipoprotein n=1 Tax=Caldovatus sediminis TaxID=2041189 RepID=A0A8J2ZF76_9PROT|nr:hypothetical protein [Caldovatus sediminis]GGG51734.1 hypothetical protein GCM10010964_43640 [Caldovatus sediminis]